MTGAGWNPRSSPAPRFTGSPCCPNPPRDVALSDGTALAIYRTVNLFISGHGVVATCS
jgi:hypothetical protein